MKMSRMLSLATAAALLASMSLPAFAAEIPVEIPQRVISEEEILAAAQPQDAVTERSADGQGRQPPCVN